MKILAVVSNPMAPRNRVIMKGLQYAGADICCCRSLYKRHYSRVPQTLWKYICAHKEDIDLIYVGFLGQPLVPIITKLTNKPILFDAFLSIYDTMCFERKSFNPNSIFGKTCYALDKSSCQESTHVILDTEAHIDYFVNQFNLDKGCFSRIFAGADDKLLFPRPDIASESGKFLVLFYGNYLPLQGIEYIVRAAHLLSTYEDIEFKLIGTGIVYPKIMRLVKDLNVTNIKFKSRVPYDVLPMEIAKADICLGGHFSHLDKARRTIATKTFECIAMRKPVIVTDGPANRELFRNKYNAFIINHSDPSDLADTILEAKDNAEQRDRIAENGYETFQNHCTPRVIGDDLRKIIDKITT